MGEGVSDEAVLFHLFRCEIYAVAKAMAHKVRCEILIQHDLTHNIKNKISASVRSERQTASKFQKAFQFTFIISITKLF